MSSIINPTTPLSSSLLTDGGLEIVGFEDQINRLVGSENADWISGGDLADIFNGDDGNDTIAGLEGDDDIHGEAGDDKLKGNEGNDSLHGGIGNDSLAGGDGNDLLLGGDGNDTINDGSGNDTLEGGAGDDRLIVRDGANVLTGGAARDTFHFKFAEDIPEQTNEITDFQVEEDRIIIQSAEDNPNAEYDSETGRLSLNGQDIIQLDAGLNIDVNDIEFIGVEPSDSEGSTVYRFFNTNLNAHLYTTSEVERDFVNENLPQYRDEGESYISVDPLTGSPEPEPVFRFFNQNTGVHLYTISEAEKEFVMKNLPNYTFEGEAFYAYATQVEGTIPVYRFYDATVDAHFYTPSQVEREFVENNLPNYSFEGIAYYTFELLPENSI